MKTIFKLLTVITTLLCLSGTSDALFENTSNAPKILLAEVNGYGEDELRPEFLASFREALGDAMQQSKVFSVDLSRLSDGMFLDLNQQQPEDKLFSFLHMDAIANGHLYRREFANAQMIRYGDSVKGKAYYQDDEKTAARRKTEGTPYNLSSNITQMAIELGNKYGVDYLLFVNVREADVFRKTGGFFKSRMTTEELEQGMKGKKVTFELEYYLINVKTGKVYEGQNAQKKSAIKRNVVIGREGKMTNATQLLVEILKDQAQQIVKGIETKGLKSV